MLFRQTFYGVVEQKLKFFWGKPIGLTTVVLKVKNPLKQRSEKDRMADRWFNKIC